MVRWNHSSSSWLDSIEASGQVERVNARFAGDCEPTPTNCHLYAAYGDTPLHQVDMNGNLVRSWDNSAIEGPIRGIVTWDGAVLFGTEDGVARSQGESRNVQMTLDVDPEASMRQQAREAGFTGDICTECGGSQMVRNGTCLKCNSCVATTGCS